MSERSERRNEKEKREMLQSEGLEWFPKSLLKLMTVDRRKKRLDTNEVRRALRLISVKDNVI